MSFGDQMKESGIERIVFVPASVGLTRGEFHAWPFDSFRAEHCGVGDTPEAAVRNAVSRRLATVRVA